MFFNKSTHTSTFVNHFVRGCVKIKKDRSGIPSLTIKYRKVYWRCRSFRGTLSRRSDSAPQTRRTIVSLFPTDAPEHRLFKFRTFFPTWLAVRLQREHLATVTPVTAHGVLTYLIARFVFLAFVHVLLAVPSLEARRAAANVRLHARSSVLTRCSALRWK